ncbi:restriction endonuclease subunit S [Acidithiobacillus thiooxidans]|uniref:Type-1 restriction enzyme EcoKI specificity protein n=1 Tax=Acidithiobacillus thiooxidans ATCC 19377 TaxID=637390 RepID=A0A543Q5R3_ACITH|nr:restriction endonuclease subunit S [Acidithiobacillus thiooxidans]MDX5934120.1 restriction endonuclease subunit S [Acidithiobacillus thiooxidans]TQN51661.1 Type-1 restriction enzyme EcoKI specificity protein [Acidithiobacillus thiooxidans ATCC 19377]
MSSNSVRLKFICRLGYGDSLPKGEEFAGDVPVFGSNGQYTTTSARNTDVPAIVLGRKGSYGKVNWAPVGCFASDTTFFVDERLTAANLRWLYWSLQTLSLDEGSLEAAVPGLNRDSVYDERVWLPSLTDQSSVANYLDRETTRIDALIAEKEHMLALLEEKRTALISRVVTCGLDPNASLKPSGQEWLGEIPAHWGLQRLKQLADVRGGLTLGKQYSGELLEYPYLRVANVQDGYLKLDDILTVVVPASEAASNLLAYGDVLMNEGGDIDKLGRGCVWRDEIAPCLHQNHVFAVRPHSVDPEWLALWTSTLQAKRYFESRAKRSTNLASISGSNVKELPVLLPPVAEQLAIQQFLVDRHSRLEAVRKELRDSLRLLSERRAALITAAVTGQIPIEEMTQ